MGLGLANYSAAYQHLRVNNDASIDKKVSTSVTTFSSPAG